MARQRVNLYEWYNSPYKKDCQENHPNAPVLSAEEWERLGKPQTFEEGEKLRNKGKEQTPPQGVEGSAPESATKQTPTFTMDMNETKESIYNSVFADLKPTDLSKPTPPPTPALFGEGRGFFWLGALHCIKAPRKSGKSYAVKLFSGAFLRGSGWGISSNTNVAKKILIFDTEQPNNIVELAEKQIHRICGWSETESNKDLQMYPILSLSAEDRFKAIVAKCYQERPSLVFIDGITDLFNTINDERDTTRKVEELMRVAQDLNIAIVGIIHMKKGEENARGWVGTIWENKCAHIFSVKCEDGIFTIHQEPSRGGEIEKDISFTIAKDGTLEDAEERKRNIEQERKEKQELNNLIKHLNEIRGVFRKINKEKTTYTELLENIQRVLKLAPEGARTRLKTEIRLNTIVKTEGGSYVFNQGLYDSTFEEPKNK